MTVTRIEVKVVPGARSDDVVGWLGDALKLRVAAAPERGRANAAVVRLLAGLLELPEKAVRVVAGGRSPRKTIEITGRSTQEIRARVAACRPDADPLP